MRDLGVAGVFGMNMQTSALMKTRIHLTAARLAGTSLLILLTISGSAQRNEVLPSPKVVDPATGQIIPVEPVQLQGDLDERIVDVDFDRLELPEIVTWLWKVFHGVNFVVSPMFPGRPVALIGPAGDQRLVFLDEPAPDLPPRNL
jgi:hypothetical protein